MTHKVELFEGIVARDTPHGKIVLHVPLIRWRGQFRNANTGILEPWLRKVETMAGARAVLFTDAVARTVAKLERLERESRESA